VIGLDFRGAVKALTSALIDHRPSVGSPATFRAGRYAAFKANSRKTKMPIATPRCVEAHCNPGKLNAPFIRGQSRSSSVISVAGYMPKHLDAALEHIRRMETRIARQSELMERLSNSGEDTSAASERLQLLKSVLGEMRLQLGQLTPTKADASRKSAAPRRPKPPNKK